MLPKIVSIALLLLITNSLSAQVPFTDLYQYNLTSVDPAFTGLDGQKATAIGAWCKACIGGISNGGVLAYEIPVENINSAFGATVISSELGPTKTSYFNFLYNYRIKINESKEVIVGMKAGMQRYTIDHTMYIPIDPGDPLLNQPSKTISLTPRLSLSAMYKLPNFYVGLSADNLIQSNNDYVDGEFRYNLFVGGDYKLAANLSVSHSLYALNMSGYNRVDVNNIFVIKDFWIAGVSFSGDEGGFYTKANAGLRFKKLGQLVISVYSKERDVRKDWSGQLLLQVNLGKRD